MLTLQLQASTSALFKDVIDCFGSFAPSSQDMCPIPQEIPSLSQDQACLDFGGIWALATHWEMWSAEPLKGFCLASRIGYSPTFWQSLLVSFLLCLTIIHFMTALAFPLASKLLEAKTYALHRERQGHTLSSLPVAITRLDSFLRVEYHPIDIYHVKHLDYKL